LTNSWYGLAGDAGSGVVKEPRAALAALGMDVRETSPTAEENWCCGGGAGAFLINRAEGLRHKAWEIKREQIDATESPRD